MGAFFVFCGICVVLPLPIVMINDFYHLNNGFMRVILVSG